MKRAIEETDDVKSQVKRARRQTSKEVENKAEAEPKPRLEAIKFVSMISVPTLA